MAADVGINLYIEGEQALDSVIDKMREFAKIAEKRVEIRAGAEEAEKQIIDLTAKLNRAKKEMADMGKTDEGFEKKAKEIQGYKNQLRDARLEKSLYAKGVKMAAEAERKEANAKKEAAKEAAQLAKEEAKAAREAEKLANQAPKLKTFSDVYNKWSSKVAHLGSAMQSAGNALTNLTSPFRDITRGMLMGVGYNALGKFTEGLSNGFERMDIMNKYARNLQVNFNKTADEADKLKQSLNEAVEGLPTGLDEIVNMANQFTASMGDADRAAKLAIATNNAFLASQASESARYQGMMQLRDVIGGKDMNAKEWQSLAASMLPAIRMIGEEMGLTGEALNDYVASVQSGKVANQEFLDQLIKYGTSGKIVTTARLAMDTWEAFFSRIGTASSRMTYGILTSLDELVKSLNLVDKDGQAITSLNRLLDSRVIPGIDHMTESVKGWINAHPEEITEFFKAMGDIDWPSILKGWAQGMMEIAQGIEWVSKFANGRDLAWIGKWGIRLNILGKALTIFGGLIKGSRIPIAGLIALLSRFGGKGNLLGRLAKMIFGDKGEGVKDLASIPKATDTLRGVVNGLGGLLKASGAITLVAGTGFISFKAVKSMLGDLKEIGDILDNMTWIDAATGANIVLGIGVMTKVFEALGNALGTSGLLGVAIASAATTLVTGTFAADMWLIKQGVAQIRDTIYTIDEVASAINNMQGITSISDSVKEKFRTTIESINEIKKMFEGKSGSKMDRGVVEAGLPTFSLGKVSALTNIANAITQMQKIVAEFNKLSVLTVNDPSEVIQQIKDACTKLQGIRVSKGLLKQSTRIADSLIQIRRMAYHINKLAGTEVNTGGFATFVQNIKSALAEMQSLNGDLMLDIEVKLSPMFGSSVKGVIKNIKNARKQIEAFKKPIQFTVPVNVTFSVVTNARDAIAKMKQDRDAVNSARNNVKTRQYSATGGSVSRNRVLYRSFGGSIFRPRGTDKVPAMLTEGEFVQRKQAVDLFGLEFMKKINNLDIRGAMQSLMMRSGSNTSIRKQSIVNNTVNNNQRVVQNISTNNPDFATARMGRFVGAL